MKKLAELLKDFTIDDSKKYNEITGIVALDQILTPAFESQNLIIIGSVKRGGKTLLASQMVMNLAEFGKHPILYFAFKESSQLMFKRFLSQKYSPRRIFGKEQFDQSDEMFGWACADIKKLPIWIADNTPLSMEELLAYIWSFAQDNKDAYIIIDGLQDLGTINLDKAAQYKEWGEIAVGLKQSAIENNVCVVLTCEFSKNPIPGISNIIGGRGVDQAADLIMQLHNPAQYEDDIPAGDRLIEIHVLKNRGGAEAICNIKMHQDVLVYVPPV